MRFRRCYCCSDCEEQEAKKKHHGEQEAMKKHCGEQEAMQRHGVEQEAMKPPSCTQWSEPPYWQQVPNKNQKLISHLSESDRCEIVLLIFFGTCCASLAPSMSRRLNANANRRNSDQLVERFFVVCCVVPVAGRGCFDPMKMWFPHIQDIRAAQARMHQKTLKNYFLGGTKDCEAAVVYWAVRWGTK